MKLDLVDLFPKIIGGSQLTSLNTLIIQQAMYYIDTDLDNPVTCDVGFTANEQRLGLSSFASVLAQVKQ